jgi:hypothetical protein
VLNTISFARCQPGFRRSSMVLHHSTPLVASSTGEAGRVSTSTKAVPAARVTSVAVRAAAAAL